MVENEAMNVPRGESLEAFLQSFAYGSRNDLLFKFLHTRNALEEPGGAEFIRRLLELLDDAFDTGDYSTVMDHCVSSQIAAYTPAPGSEPAWSYEDTPWSPLTKPLAESRVALLSTGGLFVDGHDPLPAEPTQEEVVPKIDEFLRSEPILSEIPRDVDRRKLRVRHPGYDVRGAIRDHNVLLPLDHLIEAERDGTIGEFAETAYSFVGAASQLRLKKDTGPKWAEMLRKRRIDAALLVGA